MIDFYILVAIILLLLGIIGSILPGIPGPIFSILGILLYWWSTGYEEPGRILFFFMIGTAILALVLDYAASYIGAEKSGSSKETAIAAAVSSVVFFIFTGPIGILFGAGIVVFLREILLGKNVKKAFRSASITTLALLGSTVSKVFLTVLVLILFVISLLI